MNTIGGIDIKDLLDDVRVLAMLDKRFVVGMDVTGLEDAVTKLVAELAGMDDFGTDVVGLDKVGLYQKGEPTDWHVDNRPLLYATIPEITDNIVKNLAHQRYRILQ